MNIIVGACCLYFSARHLYGYRWELTKRVADKVAQAVLDYMRSN